MKKIITAFLLLHLDYCPVSGLQAIQNPAAKLLTHSSELTLFVFIFYTLASSRFLDLF